MAFSRRAAEPISSTSLAEPPTHFFKVILPATLEEKKLRIPDAFVRKFGDELSAVVTLTVPNGRTWHVQLTKDEKKIWFHYGWHEFVKYHSISAGYFLVFKYGKNSNFHVLIFDQTAGEIQYPYYCGVLEQNSNRDEMRIYDKAVDKCRRSSSKMYTSPSQLNRCGKCGASFETPKFTDPNNPDSSTHNELEEGIEKDTKFHESASPRKRTRMTVERERAFNIAKAFEPDNPFCRVVLRPSYLHKKCFMYFPSYFAKKHLKGVSGLIKLQTCDGKQRPARCVYRGDSAKLTHGWYEFTLENNLGEGDVCIFELLRSGDIVLKVTVFRVLETAQFVNQPSSDSAPGSTMFQKRVTSHENPKFRYGIDVGSKRCKIEELDEIDKSDAVGDEVKAHFSDEENEIKKIYKLELLLEDQGIFVHRKFGSLSAEERERASTAARLLKPKYPSFMIILQPYNLKYYVVNVPAKFGNKYLSHDSKCIEVQDSVGREWPLLLIFHHGFCIKGRARFYREMNLSEGDVCIFELIRVKEPRLKVSVFNASTK